MTKEMKQEFTLRITNANKSETIVILCDMLLAYTEDAKNAFTGSEGKAAFGEAIRKARACLSELINSLNRNYEIAGHIYELYRYTERQLIAAQVKQSIEPLSEVGKVISRLNESYREVARMDSSPALMGNTETVYAGMTYGRNQITESSNAPSNRGFFV